MLNKVTLIGYVGKNPVSGELKNGGKYARFSVATSEKYTDRDGNQQENTTWHNVVGFQPKADRGLASIVEAYVRSGSQVYIEGKLVASKPYTNEHGVQVQSYEIVIQDLKLLGKKDKSANENVTINNENQNKDVTTSDSEIPF